MHPRITEILANPAGTDRGKEWVELCAEEATDLASYQLQIGTRQLQLQGSIPAGTCSIARTGTATVRNREASVSLLYKGEAIQSVTTAGTAPEGAGFQVGSSSFWATATPGVRPEPAPALPPLPDLHPGSIVPGMLGTAACVAGILTASALIVLRYARNRHYAHDRRDQAPGRRGGFAPAEDPA